MLYDRCGQERSVGVGCDVETTKGRMLTSMLSKTTAIKNFLKARAPADLAHLYSFDLEVQVNVAQGSGEPIRGEFHGTKWQGFTDGIQTWKAIRIPWGANKDPKFTDSPMTWDLDAHAHAIGMTGWDWKTKVSRWVGFDFDDITNHADGLTENELNEIKDALFKISWATIRQSTGGRGLHIYVFLDPVPTETHNEHAALARAILGKLAALTGINLQAKIDVCGHILWIWRQGYQGLKLIQQGEILSDIPPNWKDHLDVVTGKRRRNLPQFIDEPAKFTDLVSQLERVPLDDGHKMLINYLKDTDCLWWWENDHHMMVTHTIHLKEAFNYLDIKGLFDTNATGKERGQDHNCFLFPLRGGAWTVRRYGPGVAEHPVWSQDGRGWTYTFFNREPDLKTVARYFGATEDLRSGFVFREAEVAIKAAAMLGIKMEIPSYMNGRNTILRRHKDGRIVIEIDREDRDDGGDMLNWLVDKKIWYQLASTNEEKSENTEIGVYDDTIRHLVSGDGQDLGWAIRSDNLWRREPLQHVKACLKAMGHAAKDIDLIIGASVFRCWKLVNKPFEDEYTGEREWNRYAAKLRFTPSQDTDELRYPHWTKILSHIGTGLDSAIKRHAWARANNILTGADYLKCWVASIFKDPEQPLPYLFLYGPENSGKSILHEALNLLMTAGYARADNCLISTSGFNAELTGAVVCVVEETDLRKNPQAHNRIKDWVTSPQLPIHEKNRTPTLITNTTHWIQCANTHTACPIIPGDTRITMVHVDHIDPLDLVPKRQLMLQLEKEAPDFLAELLRLEIPASNDRLNVPVVVTEEKSQTASLNRNLLDMYLEEMCLEIPGMWIKFSELTAAFKGWVDPTEESYWTSVRVGKSLPPHIPKGRQHKDGQWYVGNICWKHAKPEVPPDFKLVFRDPFLEQEPL